MIMKENSIDRRGRSSQYLYNQHMNSSDCNHIESKETFREGMTNYSVSDDRIFFHSGTKDNIHNKGGIPVDYDADKKIIYVDSSDSHTLLIGSTGAKKSRLVVMPTVKILGAAGESMIISDPKAEIYKRTADNLEQKGYYISVINLRDPKVGDGWNFLTIPYEKYVSGDIDKACEMVNDAAVTLIPIKSHDPYWDYSARDLFVGLVLLLFKIAKENAISTGLVNMRYLLKVRNEMFLVADTKKIQETLYWKEVMKDELIKAKLNGIVICPENTMACILSTFDQHVSCFSLQPQMIELLSNSTINFEKIGFQKSVVYIIMPDEKTTYHKLVTIFVKQVYEYLIDLIYGKQLNEGFPVRVNFILDEFSSLPSINDFPQMIAAARSRNIRFHLVMQSKNQLRQRYSEEADTIQSNCNNWLFLHTREIDLLREISSLAGLKGQKELIPVSTLQHLNKEKGECLIFSGRKYPYYAYLADIDVFDNTVYEILPMKQRIVNNETIWDIEELIKKRISKGRENKLVDDIKADFESLDDFLLFNDEE